MGTTGEPNQRFLLEAFSLYETGLGNVVREECMELTLVEAVLKAADEWVSAQEALVAARQVSKEAAAEQVAVDIAGSRLVVAVTRWRSSRRMS